MMTVNDVSKLTGVSIRTLQYYDKIGLLAPTAYTKSGYRQYDDTALEQLQQILLFRELEFPLKDIKKIMNSPDYDRSKALEQQIELLMLKKEHIENLITLAREIKVTGGKFMEFTAFNTKKLEEYTKQAKEYWGATPEYKEFEEKNSNRTISEVKDMGKQLMAIVAGFGALKEHDASEPVVQAQVKKLQDFITEHYYNCTDTILSQLGLMYAGGGEFTANIDRAGGNGAVAFANEAIQIFCRK
ncbi:MAG: MerR family transcriptional regulator [Anaerovoracaceae bacterium]